MSDVKTLRLVSAQLTAESLNAFMVYQRSVIASLGSTSAAMATWAGRFAFAHSKALAECGLDALTQQRLRVPVSEFCGKRSASLVVKQRLADAALSTPGPRESFESAEERAPIERATKELARLSNFGDFVDRYGQAAFDLLTMHETELVSLHRELSRLEGAGGHVHAG
jgi:hypothetical protein